MVITVEIKMTGIASNMRWPNHRPTGLFNPFENCMAWTDERRSFDTYKVKKAGYTAYERRVMRKFLNEKRVMKRTITSPKKTIHLK